MGRMEGMHELGENEGMEGMQEVGENGKCGSG